MGDVPFEDELETLVGNQFFPKHVAFFNCPSNTTFYSNSFAENGTAQIASSGRQLQLTDKSFTAGNADPPPRIV